MRLLIAVDSYVPARISAALQMHDLARELLAQGHRPTVLVPDSTLPGRWRMDEIDGVQVLRVRAARTKDVGLLRRAVAEGLLSFAMLLGLRLSSEGKTRWDGVIWYSPTIFLGPLAAWIRHAHRCRGYLILRDLFPDWAVDAGLMNRGLAYRFFKAVERYQYGVADRIGVQTAANVSLVQSECRDSARVEVLNNWLAPPAQVVPGLDLSSTPLRGRIVFAYAGNMGAAQGMDCLLDLARAMREDERVGFLFVGRGSERDRLRNSAREDGLGNVLFVDEVPANEVPSILSQCHVGLIALDVRHTTHNIPGKFLTYLHARLPVLARLNPRNDLITVIQTERVGFVSSDSGIEELVEGARTLARDAELRVRMQQNAAALVSRDYAPQQIVRQVIAGLEGRDTRDER